LTTTGPNTIDSLIDRPLTAPLVSWRRQLLARYPLVVIAGIVLITAVLIAIFAPLVVSGDPLRLNPTLRLRPPEVVPPFGTDMFGREVLARVVYGARISLMVGACAAIAAVSIGLLIGVVAGYIRWLDAIVMRIMDGMMAIPAVLLAVALASLNKGAAHPVLIVILAITIPEIPRVVRLVRAIVLSVREEPYVEAAIAVGTPLPKLMWRHVIPNCVPPLIVQATYICASAMLTEAILSFLGAGTPPEIPSWGNMMAEGRGVFRIAPWIVLAPGLALAVVILAINIMGDGLRDRLDPKLAKRV
jgi:peptide/nickel transport system permease protein